MEGYIWAIVITFVVSMALVIPFYIQAFRAATWLGHYKGIYMAWLRKEDDLE